MTRLLLVLLIAASLCGCATKPVKDKDSLGTKGGKTVWVRAIGDDDVDYN